MNKTPRRGKARAHRRESSSPIVEEDMQAKLQGERERLIHERQGTVARVLDRHDEMVRELFHLERFVSLLSYSPEEAKKDVSPVFLNYKAAHDIVNHTATSGPSRATRRAHTERMQSLKADTIQSPAGSASKKTRNGIKSNAEKDTIWSLLASAKGKSKAPSVNEGPASPVVTSNRRARVKSLESEPAFALLPATPAHGVGETAGISSSVSRYRRRITMGPPTDLPPTKKRKLDTPFSSSAHSDDFASSVSAAEVESSPLHRRSRRSVAGKSVDSLQRVPIETPILDGTQTSLTPVRRVTLIVRKPPPTFSNPRQKPPPPKFNSSVKSFLQSYTAIDDENVDNHTLQEMARKDAAVWKQVDAFRRRGRMLHRPLDVVSSNSSNSRGPDRTPDLWDHVIKGATEHAQKHQPSGRQIAAQVASRVRAYWETQALRDDKAKAQEEKRLRALAKVTIRLVTTKWRDVVYHIRDQERKKREAEERRRGHEHLDAILDQSGQILEAQQIDLTRGDGVVPRSRSTSLSAPLRPWASASPLPDAEDESDSDDGADTENDSGSHEDSDDESEEAVDSGQLLIRSSKRPASPATSEGFDEFKLSLLQSNHIQTLRTEPFEDHPSDSSLAILNGKRNGLKRHPLSHQLSSPIDSTSDCDVRVKIGTQTVELSSAWREEAHVESPTQRKLALQEASSGRSSIVPDSQWEPRNDDSPALSEPRDLEEIPPDTPVSVAFDALSSTSVQDVETVDAPINTDADLVGPHLNGNSALTSEFMPQAKEDSDSDDEEAEDSVIPAYLRPYAVAPVSWDSDAKVKAPPLLRGTLRPYQQAGLEWLASLHTNNLNGILADEMGLGKTIQTISLLAHLACDRGIWGPHLIIVPTSVLLNWEMEFKKFLPGFKVLSYHGNTKRRKELRQGWNNKYHFNVCVTSYTLASRDAHVFKRKAWYYMILDEAHMIKNFKSQRWNILLMFRSFRRLLLTGTPLQNNLTELWALLQFLMSGTNFANLKEFGEWFSNPLEKAIESGTALDDDNMQRVAKLHTVLRPYLLRRLKRDVEKELPSKFEHLVLCPLSKRQRFLYDEFMARADTRHDLQSGVYHKIANILMQLRKVVNHPNLFEVRPITTSFAMSKSAIADFEIKELLVRRELLRSSDEDELNLEFLGLKFLGGLNVSIVAARETSRLDGTAHLPMIEELPDVPPPKDTRTIDGYRRYKAYLKQAETATRWKQIAYINNHRCNRDPVLSSELIAVLRQCHTPLLPLSVLDKRSTYLDTADRLHSAIKSYTDRAEEMSGVLERFVFATPAVVAGDMPAIALSGHRKVLQQYASDIAFDSILHPVSVKLQIAFPDPSLLQFDCGKLQELAHLLRERKAGGHRILIFTQMTRVLDILEVFLNYHGYLYLRLDGATKIEDRQYITERFNTDARIFCFISSSRSGGVGINLTGADTVIFYDSDFNPQMDRQCEDRAHRIGQIRDVHIYRFISRHTVEEALLRKANQKRSLDDIVIQRGEFDWRTLFRDEGALTKALGEVEDTEDAYAAAVAAREAIDLEGADEADFAWEGHASRATIREEEDPDLKEGVDVEETKEEIQVEEPEQDVEADEEDEGGTVDDYMLAFVRLDMEFFGEWRLPGFKE